MPITVTSIQPTTGVQGTTLTCDVGGTGFTADCAVKLKRSVLEVPGTGVQVLSPSLLRATFALPYNLVPQLYNVVVSNDVPESAQLTNGFMCQRHGARGRVHHALVIVADEDELDELICLVVVEGD